MCNNHYPPTEAAPPIWCTLLFTAGIVGVLYVVAHGCKLL